MKKTVREWRKTTQEELNQGFPEMILVREYEVDVDTDYISEEKKRYDQRVLDGQNAYLMLMAELRLTSKQNNYPREVNKFIEEKLELVRSQVVSGQWISAREKLDLVVVESYLTQELYDRIKLKLDTYISKNY